MNTGPSQPWHPENGTIPPDDAAAHDEQLLVAYLDGELDEAASSDIEQRLASDEPYRRRLQQLDRAWNLLDELPRATVDEQFTRSTIEMVAVAAEAEAAAHHVDRRRRTWERRSLLAALLSAALLGGYLATARLLPDPHQQMLRDLPVIERMDQYQAVEGIEALERFEKEGLFAEDDDAL
jgi:anti-sigma factor RsiW